MFRVLTCLTTEHDWRLVIVAGVVCFLASLTAISMFNRARATEDRSRAGWIVAAGAATGCGIWATHFIAMLAYDPGISVAYNLGLTALSLLAAAVVTGAGLSVAVYVPGRWGGPVAGAIVGGGIACMHYTGMWAVELPGRIT
jgi:NO-binding membrane sensor protein with MHYT domain